MLFLRPIARKQYEYWLHEMRWRAKYCTLHFVNDKQLRLGEWASWTVEGFNLGLRIFRLADPARVHPSVKFKVVERDGRGHFPEIMQAREEFGSCTLFKMLSGSRESRRLRDQLLGRHNWAVTASWVNPHLDHVIDRGRFQSIINAAFRQQLRAIRHDLDHVAGDWCRGECLITPAMRRVYPHLAVLEESADEAVRARYFDWRPR
jgi:hypothetical protein